MIISEDKKYIFIAVPKSGSQTIRFSLKDNLINYHEQCGLYERKKIKICPYLSCIKTGHITFSEISNSKCYFKSSLDSFYIFSFVRNPYDRFISSFFFMKKNISYKNVIDDMKRSLGNMKDCLWYKPQTHFLKFEDNICNFYKIENITDSLSLLSQKFNYSIPLIVKNVNNYINDEYYSDVELKEMVELYYLDDFTNFNYTLKT